MRRAALFLAAFAALLLAGLGLADHLTNTEEHVLPGATVTGPWGTLALPDRTVTDQDPVPHPITVTVTEPTTTASPPPPPPPPPPPLSPPAPQPDIIQSTQWICRGEQDRNLVRITIANTGADAVQFRVDCRGRIGRLEVSGHFADCVKVSPVEPEAHDLRIESGFCDDQSDPMSGDHRDCIQAGGGDRILFRNFAWDCEGGGGGNLFIASFNGGTPTRITCDHCAFGPNHPNQIRTPSDPNSGVMNSRVCLSESGRTTYGPASSNLGGNHSPAADSPECTFSSLLAYVGGS